MASSFVRDVQCASRVSVGRHVVCCLLPGVLVLPAMSHVENEVVTKEHVCSEEDVWTNYCSRFNVLEHSSDGCRKLAQLGEHSSGDREVPGSMSGVSRSSERAPQMW